MEASSSDRLVFQASDNHLDYIDNNGDTRLPQPDSDGIIGLLELAGDTDIRVENEFLEFSGSRMILLDAQAAKNGKLNVILSKIPPENLPDGSVILLDARALELNSESGIFESGILVIEPSKETHTIGRAQQKSRETFGWNEYQHGKGISANHFDVRNDESGVYVSDRGSRNRTVLATGTYARESIDASYEHNEHVIEIKRALGEQATNDVVEITVDRPQQLIVSKEEVTANQREFVYPSSATAQVYMETLLNNSNKSTLANVLRSFGADPSEVLLLLQNEKNNMTQNGIRDAVKQTLMVRLESIIETLPSEMHQLRMNTIKNINNAERYGYPGKMDSRDYAVEIALSYLDGSFDVARETQDPSGGHHRKTAKLLLTEFLKETTSKSDHFESGVEENPSRVVARQKAHEFQQHAGMLHSSILGISSNLKESFMRGYADTENASSDMRRIADGFDEVMMALSHSMSTLTAASESDETLITQQHIQELRELVSYMNQARDSFTFDLIRSRQYYPLDEQALEQTRNIVNNGMYDEQVDRPLRYIISRLEQLSSELKQV